MTHHSPGSRASHAAGAILMLVLVRITRAWNQTGQKYAGEPDIVKIFLHPNPLILWSMVTIVYIWIHRMLIHGFNGIPAPISYAAITGSVLAAISFKMHFTQEDAPELVVGFARTIAELDFTQGQSLVSQARAVFMALGIATAVALFYILMKWRLSVTGPGTSPPSPPYTTPH